jgi:hypothetical protein
MNNNKEPIRPYFFDADVSPPFFLDLLRTECWSMMRLNRGRAQVRIHFKARSMDDL